jgi:hypothetical protein
VKPCALCKWWVPVENEVLDLEDGMGECRRLSPYLRPQDISGREQHGQWPLTQDDWGCGEWSYKA